MRELVFAIVVVVAAAFAVPLYTYFIDRFFHGTRKKAKGQIDPWKHDPDADLADGTGPNDELFSADQDRSDLPPESGAIRKRPPQRRNIVAFKRPKDDE